MIEENPVQTTVRRSDRDANESHKLTNAIVRLGDIDYTAKVPSGNRSQLAYDCIEALRSSFGVEDVRILGSAVFASPPVLTLP